MRVKTTVERLQNLTYISNRVANIMDTIDYITQDKYIDDLKASNLVLLVDAKLLLISFLRANAQTISAVSLVAEKAITDPTASPIDITVFRQPEGEETPAEEEE